MATSGEVDRDALLGLQGEGAGVQGWAADSRHATLRKALLKAQRDYHPDRNQNMVRDTLGCSPEEWEVLCLTICQQLALAYDKLYKHERTFEFD